MNLRRILNLAAAFAAVAAAAVVVVVAAAFAVYALGRVWVGPAGAAALTAAAFAAVALLVAWLATRKAVPPRSGGDDASLIDRLVEMARERPLIALGAVAAVVTVVVRNPALITAVVSAFMAGSAAKPEKS